MTLKVKTTLLQKLVSKAVKGASLNKMIPLTQLMEVELSDGTLALQTTDASNKLVVMEDKVEGKEFYVVVPVELFSKLVAKTSSEYIKLTLKGEILKFKGNGDYDIPLSVDEEGDLITFPEIEFDVQDSAKVQMSTIRTFLTANKAALAETMEIPCLTNYYSNAKGVATTDTFKVCYNENPIYKEEILIPGDLMNLLSVFETEDVAMDIDEDTVMFSTANAMVFGYLGEDIEDYPAEALNNYLESEFPSSCVLPKDAVLKVLDRLSLFVSAYATNGVYLTFDKKGVTFSSGTTGSELVKYQDSDNFQPYRCFIDNEMLKEQISASAGETFKLWYGHDTAVKMTGGKITQIVALLEDEQDTDDE